MMVLFVGIAYSQEKETMPTGTSEAAVAAGPVAEAPAVKEISIYGEVQGVNAPANSMTVQYYDYDSDEGKTIDITTNKDTKIENASGIDRINKGDWVDVTYAVSEGKNLAKTVIVEKEETAEPMPEQTSAAPAE
jgi:hypothetical protein